MKTNVNCWNFICNHINSKQVGSVISRREMIEEYIEVFSSYSKTSTLDGYRHLLTRIGVLKKSSFGYYTKLQDVPVNLSCTKARRIATDPLVWKNWFVELEDR